MAGERAYVERIYRVWDKSGYWYTQVSPDPDGLPGMTEVSHWDRDKDGKFTKTASFLLHLEELNRFINICSIRSADAAEEVKL